MKIIFLRFFEHMWLKKRKVIREETEEICAFIQEAIQRVDILDRASKEKETD